MIGLALVAQTFAWSMLTFTGVRYIDYQEVMHAESGTVETVVTPQMKRAEALRSIGANADADEGANVNVQLSAWDGVLRSIANLGSALGVMGALAILPLIGLGVVLAAGAATDGIEKTTGAFVWAIILLMLTLPWNVAFESVPFTGLFASYATLSERVVDYRAAADTANGTTLSAMVMFYGRSLLLPMAAICGVAAIALRFRAGVEAGLFPKEDYRLDPELEAEAANIKASSLVGGGARSTGALNAAMKDKTIVVADVTPDPDPETTTKKKERKTKRADQPLQPQPEDEHNVTPASASEVNRRPMI